LQKIGAPLVFPFGDNASHQRIRSGLELPEVIAKARQLILGHSSIHGKVFERAHSFRNRAVKGVQMFVKGAVRSRHGASSSQVLEYVNTQK